MDKELRARFISTDNNYTQRRKIVEHQRGVLSRVINF